jgi:ubiquinone/menaquinone biosynthesis C-methylase UbiE
MELWISFVSCNVENSTYNSKGTMCSFFNILYHNLSEGNQIKMGKKQKIFSFGKRAEKYDYGFEGRFSQKFYSALLSKIEPQPDEMILDVGCGTGYLLRKIADRCRIKGYGIDLEYNMIQVAKKRCPDMDIRQSTCENIPFGDSTFHIITACMAYHHFSDQEGFAREAARILKTGGYLYIADPRLHFIIRKAINGLLNVLKVMGHFSTVQETADRFIKYGFVLSGSFEKGYVQIVELKKIDKDC